MSFFNNYIIRSPLFSIQLFFEMMQDYNDDKLFNFYKENLQFQAAIQLASIDFATIIENYINDPTSTSEDKKKQLEQSLYKYFARATSRCTPFGLFAGSAVGNFSHQTLIKRSPFEENKLHNQLDMHFLYSFIFNLEKKTEIRKNLLFIPNNSIYDVGFQYRYIYYKQESNRRVYHISTIKKTEVIKKILSNNEYKSINEWVSLIADKNEVKEATKFVNQLIANQILVSDWEPSVSGNDIVSSLITRIAPLKSKIANQLENSIKCLEHLNAKKLNVNKALKEIELLANRTNTIINKKHILQTDLYLNYSENQLKIKNAYKTERAVKFVSKLFSKPYNNNIENFKKAFLNRYDNKEMPLNLVLDTEMGIGYPVTLKNNYFHELLDTVFNGTTNENLNYDNKSIHHQLLSKKIKECYSKKENKIVLKEDDVVGEFNLSNTFSAMVEIFEENGSEKIALNYVNTTSANKLIGRFTLGDKKIHDLAQEISFFEFKKNEDKILAEIVHIPQDRTGNVLRRAHLRDFEIPYITKSNLPNNKQITSNDLLVSIVNNQIVLKSAKFQKIVIPCLSNAHNYSFDSLPMYHFLADLQNQNNENFISFDWGPIKEYYNFFPRVEYNDVIISKAKWKISITDLITFIDIKLVIKNLNIPRYVFIEEGDNTLLLDLELNLCLELLERKVRNDKQLFLVEFIRPNSKTITYCNQFIFNYKND